MKDRKRYPISRIEIVGATDVGQKRLRNEDSFRIIQSDDCPDNIDGALRVLKKRLQYDGISNELRKRDHFISRGEKRRQAKKAGKRREQREIQKRLEEFGF